MDRKHAADRAEYERLVAEYFDARQNVKGDYASRRALYLRVVELFGAMRGWRFAERTFGWRALIRGNVRIENFCMNQDGYDPPGCDHTVNYFLGTRPIAIATHPYIPAFEEVRHEAEAFAKKWKLGLEYPEETSWHYPERTTFILWTAPEKLLTREEVLTLDNTRAAPRELITKTEFTAIYHNENRKWRRSPGGYAQKLY